MRGPLRHARIIEKDACTDVVCHELAQKGQPGAREVRMGKLGGRVLLVVGDQRVVMNSLEEVPTAASRIASATAQGKTVEETPARRSGGRRRDAPITYASDGIQQREAPAARSTYVAPVSLMVDMIFH